MLIGAAISFLQWKLGQIYTKGKGHSNSPAALPRQDCGGD